ncbi:mCG141894, partial [Mus musculus]
VWRDPLPSLRAAHAARDTHSSPPRRGLDLLSVQLGQTGTGDNGRVGGQSLLEGHRARKKAPMAQQQTPENSP